MIQWKPQPAQYGGGDSVFAAEFAKAEPAIAKQLCDADGKFIDKKEVTVGGYSYRAKIVQDGKFIFVTRKQTYVGLGDEKPEETAHKQVQQEFVSKAQAATLPPIPKYAGAPAKGDWSAKTGENPFDQRQKDIAIAHTENMAASMALTSAIMTLANELQGLKHLVEIMVDQSGAIKNSFKSADKMGVKTGGGNNTA